MTPEQFAYKMGVLRKAASEDLEVAHEEADAMMCTILEELGYGQGVAIFEDIHKYYH
jgi:hypothetical protein